jgi:hypothetical protein
MLYLWEKYSFLIILMIITFMMGLFLIFNISEDEGTYITITINEGDSLWSISEQYAEQVGMRTPELVKLLERENRLTSNLLRSGQELIIPANLIEFKANDSEFAFHSE